MLILYKNYKYDNRYDYVKMFKTRQEQTDYFMKLEQLVIYPWTSTDEMGYIKQNETFCVDVSYDELTAQGINYLSFANEFNGKEYFAFITQKEYVNETTSRIYFEIDVIQTFMFDVNLKKSFVERKHCSINEIADYDEGLEIGEHVIVSDKVALTKDYEYFAMFNGIKEQSISLNADGSFNNCIEMPYVTSKPTTSIDGIAYPLYFMPLRDTYADVKVTPINPDIVITDSVVGSVRKMLGKPYIWGGNYPPLGSSMGTDCSGLCQWAYNDSGLIKQCQPALRTQRWTTYNMIANCKIVPINQAKPGDVVFTNFSSPGVPEHVMMLVDINIERMTVVEACGGSANNEQNPGMPPEKGVLEHTYNFNSNIHQIGRLIYV